MYETAFRIPTWLDVVYFILTVLIYKVIPITLVISYILKLLYLKSRDIVSMKRLNLKISLLITLIPYFIIIVAFYLSTSQSFSLYPLLLLLLISLLLSFTLFVCHEGIDRILKQSTKRKFIVFVVMSILGYLLYPKIVYRQNISNGSTNTKTCQCMGAKVDYLCFGVSYACTYEIKKCDERNNPCIQISDDLL